MKARPMLFSGPMPSALIEDRKTNTRRVVKPQPIWVADPGVPFRTPDADPDGIMNCPYGKPGDLLYVKENAWMWCQKLPDGTTKTGRQKWRYEPIVGAPIHYQADHPAKPSTSIVSPAGDWGWRLKIGRFLPRWASRMTLRITDVRVQRLQDISEADAQAEGVGRDTDGWFDYMQPGTQCCPTAKCSFGTLWESIHGTGSWGENHYVWAISFEVIKKNVYAYIASIKGGD